MMSRASLVELSLTSLISVALLASTGCAGNSGDQVPSPAEPQPAPAPPTSGAPAEPDPVTPAPTTPAPTTPEECVAAGGTFVPSIGNRPSCPEGKQSIGDIRHGIEGGICCK